MNNKNSYTGQNKSKCSHLAAAEDISKKKTKKTEISFLPKLTASAETASDGWLVSPDTDSFKSQDTESLQTHKHTEHGTLFPSIHSLHNKLTFSGLHFVPL